MVKGIHYNPDLPKENEHFFMCNFSQADIFTELPFTNCTFEKCNLINCLLDGSNTIIDCNIAQVKREVVDNNRVYTFYDRDTSQIDYVINEPIEEIDE